MVVYYARFRHICSTETPEIEDLIGFVEAKPNIGFKEFERLVSSYFFRMFNGKYGEYGRSYVLRDFGPVKKGIGYLVKEC